VGYDARNTHYNPNARGPRDEATVAWEQLGDKPVYPPVVAESLYLTEAWTDGAALALASDSGEQRWSNSDLPPSRWAPALHEEKLLILTRSRGNVVRLHSLDTRSGEQAWNRDEGITASSSERPPISPTVRSDSVFVPSDRGIIACDATTGDLKWRGNLGPHIVDTEGGPTWRSSWAKPAVTAERAFTFDTNDSYQSIREVYAVDSTSGDQEWTAELELSEQWSLKGSPVAGDKHVFVSALKTGMVAERGESPSIEERLFALDADSGTVAWDWSRERQTLSPPAYLDDMLYVAEWNPGADTGQLHAVDVSDGSRTWTYKTNAGAVQSPTATSDTVYVNQGSEFAAVERTNGTGRWNLEIGDSGRSVVVGETAFVQTNPGHGEDSRVLAIREP